MSEYHGDENEIYEDEQELYETRYEYDGEPENSEWEF